MCVSATWTFWFFLDSTSPTEKKYDYYYYYDYDYFELKTHSQRERFLANSTCSNVTHTHSCTHQWHPIFYTHIYPNTSLYIYDAFIPENWSGLFAPCSHLNSTKIKRVLASEPTGQVCLREKARATMIKKYDDKHSVKLDELNKSKWDGMPAKRR